MKRATRVFRVTCGPKEPEPTKPVIEFSCKGFEKMKPATQRAMVEMIKAAYAMIEKNAAAQKKEG